MTSPTLKGHFLIASPSLRDPNFARAVVLICDHSAEGALGIIINRPSPMTVGEALPDVDGAAECRDALFQGGPVQTSSVFILHDRLTVGGMPILDEVAFGIEIDLLKRLFQDPEALGGRVRLYAGYAGWGAGQLEFELSQESWIVKKARAEEVFEARGEDAWAAILRDMGGRYALMAQAPRDPGLN